MFKKFVIIIINVKYNGFIVILWIFFYQIKIKNGFVLKIIKKQVKENKKRKKIMNKKNTKIK